MAKLAAPFRHVLLAIALGCMHCGGPQCRKPTPASRRAETLSAFQTYAGIVDRTAMT